MKQQSLFGDNEATAERARKALPLAARLAPTKLEDFSGQEELFSEGKLLRRLIEADKLASAVFFGPPGCGKTALARLIASRSGAHTEELNAAIAGVAELRKILDAAQYRQQSGERTLLILDEIHHFNRTQQDVLLPSVERGQIILIGLTTENPFFYVNSALVSRFAVFEFKPLGKTQLEAIISRAVSDKEAGLGSYNMQLDPQATAHLVAQSGGDARRLLNALELAALTTKPGVDGKRQISLRVAEESIQKRAVRYDKSSDEHYDHISAFIKSMRGSDPDATAYWLAKMLAAGEDPRFLARRILICASEDVGNADPTALILAEAAFRACEVLGMPEARIPLAQAAIYIACAPKSNAAYMAINAAMSEVEKGPAREVPLHLRDASLDGESRGHGKGYKYPHDFPGHYTPQEYLPKPKTFYVPSDQGREAQTAERLAKLKKERKQ
ncbi:MAG TPA: replication-associated recombination protein A [Elusimicrobiales bacterium]|nr:replication-associated recombination protein A [Elusimicrobiales bacterium]